MGFARTPHPHIIDAARTGRVERIVTPADLAAVMREADPFLVDFACDMNGGAAHQIIASCGEVVCSKCARIFWRRP